MTKTITIADARVARSSISLIGGNFERNATVEFLDANGAVLYTRTFSDTVTNQGLVNKLTDVMVTDVLAKVKAAEGI